MAPRRGARLDDVRLRLVAAALDVLAAGVREVAVGGPEAHVPLDLVDVHAVALAEGQLTSVHGELQATGHCCGAKRHDEIELNESLGSNGSNTL